MNAKEIIRKRKLEKMREGTIRPSSRLKEIPLEDLRGNPYQPRTIMDEEDLARLAESIKEDGLIQPIAVKKERDGYIIVAGHRRTEAHRILGRRTIKAYVLEDEIEEEALASKAVAENFHRENLNPVELAAALNEYRKRFGKTLADVAKLLGKSESEVSRILSVLKLPKEILENVRKKGPKDYRALSMLNTAARKLEKSGLDARSEIERLYEGLLHYGREWLKKEIDSMGESPKKIVSPKISKSKKGVKIELPPLSDEKLDELERLIRLIMEGESS